MIYAGFSHRTMDAKNRVTVPSEWLEKKEGGEILWIDGCRVHVREDLEFVGDARVIAVGRQPVADAALAPLRLDERLDHAVGLGLLANPAVGQNRHGECVTGRFEGIKFVANISVDGREAAVS